MSTFMKYNCCTQVILFSTLFSRLEIFHYKKTEELIISFNEFVILNLNIILLCNFFHLIFLTLLLRLLKLPHIYAYILVYEEYILFTLFPATE